MRNKRLLIAVLVAVVLVLAIAGSAYAWAGKGGNDQNGAWGQGVKSGACQYNGAAANCPNVGNQTACPQASGVGNCYNFAASAAASAGNGCCGQ